MNTNSERTSSRRGATLIELMTVIVITIILAVSLSFALTPLVGFYQRGREEAFVRENLCLIYERFADALGMARAIKTGSRSDHWQAIYRMETGGVSFETNRFIRISETEYGATNLAAVLSVVHEGETNTIHMIGNATLDAILGDIESVGIQDHGEFCHVSLTACYPVKHEEGIVTNRVMVEGPVRLWNHD